ncbi:MAG TPA: hypothetical protein VI981_00685 [Candidatus Paceibacterota bacterium]
MSHITYSRLLSRIAGVVITTDILMFTLILFLPNPGDPPYKMKALIGFTVAAFLLKCLAFATAHDNGYRNDGGNDYDPLPPIRPCPRHGKRRRRFDRLRYEEFRFPPAHKR